MTFDLDQTDPYVFDDDVFGADDNIYGVLLTDRAGSEYLFFCNGVSECMKHRIGSWDWETVTTTGSERFRASYTVVDNKLLISGGTNTFGKLT